MNTTSVSPLRIFTTILLAALLTACGSTPTEDDASDVYDDGSATTIDADDGATVVGAGADGDLRGGSIDDEGLDRDLPTVFYFDFDQATLSLDIRSALDGHAAALRGGSRMIRLEGHADERGTREYNLALGERRARAVPNYLVLQGVDRARIETVSYGEERPASLGEGESAMQQNRRVEIK